MKYIGEPISNICFPINDSKECNIYKRKKIARWSAFLKTLLNFVATRSSEKKIAAYIS